MISVDRCKEDATELGRALFDISVDGTAICYGMVDRSKKRRRKKRERSIRRMPQSIGDIERRKLVLKSYSVKQHATG